MAAVHQVAPDVDLRFRRIAVLTDFSSNADTALHCAAAFARESSARLTLAHAYIPPASAYAAPEMALAYQAFEVFRDNLETRLLTQTEDACLKGIHCTILLRQGETAELLEDLGDQDLIVVGTCGHHGLERAALGSTAEKILRASTMPVLTVGPHCHMDDAGKVPIHSVIFATDLSRNTAAIAVPYAVSIASVHDAELILLHVLKNRDVPSYIGRAPASAEPLERLKRLLPGNPNLRRQPRCRIGFGAPDVVILEEANSRDAGLIVLGARKTGLFGAFARRFEEGTAYSVAARAHCPVLTVREP